MHKFYQSKTMNLVVVKVFPLFCKITLNDIMQLTSIMYKPNFLLLFTLSCVIFLIKVFSTRKRCKTQFLISI